MESKPRFFGWRCGQRVAAVGSDEVVVNGYLVSFLEESRNKGRVGSPLLSLGGERDFAAACHGPRQRRRLEVPIDWCETRRHAGHLLTRESGVGAVSIRTRFQ